MTGDQGSLFDQPDPTPFERGMAGSERSAGRWSDDERQQVRDAIRWCAVRYRAFCSDQVWARLGPTFPFTKGMAATLNGQAVAEEPIIRNTGRTCYSKRGGEHDHGQRLSIWASLLGGSEEVDL